MLRNATEKRGRTLTTPAASVAALASTTTAFTASMPPRALLSTVSAALPSTLSQLSPRAIVVGSALSTTSTTAPDASTAATMVGAIDASAPGVGAR